jgi:hypothetical protein
LLQKKCVQKEEGELQEKHQYLTSSSTRPGLLKIGGKVYVNVVQNCSKEALMPIIQGKILEGSESYIWLESIIMDLF